MSTQGNADLGKLGAEVPRVIDGPTGTEARVCQDIAWRQQLGIRKYGLTVSDNPLELGAWVRHAYEECLDQAIYLRRVLEKLDRERRK